LEQTSRGAAGYLEITATWIENHKYSGAHQRAFRAAATNKPESHKMPLNLWVFPERDCE